MPAPALPRGTATFLFTDIEGSTRLLEQLGERYAGVLQRHRELVLGALVPCGGVPVGSEGDSLFVAFERASGAVEGAIEAQRALAEAEWPAGVALRVRMGMHTGEADVVDDSYVGMAVHVAARVSAAAHGGQIVVTDVTARLAGDPAALDLGCHRLKDVGEHRLLQLRAPGLDDAFPPLRTLSALPNNLPAPVDRFVGRRTELAQLATAITEHRLVTLTGPGGSGKTRLALEAAAGCLPSYRDGVWLVPLATVNEPAGVVAAVAQALRISDRAGQAVADAVEEWLAEREVLLVLDNCEHLVDAVVAFCGRFLPACPRLRVLATSREFLGVRGEHAMRTPPLTVPDDPASAGGSDAVELFVTRAAAAAPSFDPATEDTATVLHVCRRLDGLPLAIELAAARLRSLSLAQLAARLDDRFRLLTGGSRGEVARQRTLEAVVAWSYELLGDVEREVFARLGVLPHHFTLDMAEAVAAGEPVDEADVVDVLGRLVEKSLVATVNGPDGFRYQLLETLRAYAIDRLTEAGATERYRERLFAWALRGVDHLEAVMRTPAMDDALRQATINAVTYRAAMDWAAERGHVDAALRIASVVPLAHNRGERRATIVSLLSRAEECGQLDDVVAGYAWNAIGNLAFEQSDWAASVEANGRATAHFESAGLDRLAAWARYLGVHSAWGAGDLAAVDRLVREAVEWFRSTGDEMGLGYSLWVASLRSADLDVAKAMSAEADALLRRAQVPMGVAHNVEGRGIIAYERGELDEAAECVAEAVEIFTAYGNLGCTAHALEAAALLVAARSDGGASVAAELLAAAEELRHQSGQGHRPWEIRARVGSLEDRIGALDAADAEVAARAGRGRSLAEASALAVSSLRDA